MKQANAQADEVVVTTVEDSPAAVVTIEAPEGITVDVNGETGAEVEAEAPVVTEETVAVEPAVEVETTWLGENALSLLVWGAIILALIVWIIKQRGRLIPYFRERISELMQVSFPTQKKATHTMVVVLVMMIVTGLMLGFMDWALNTIIFDVLR